MPYIPPYRRTPEKAKRDRFDIVTLAVAIVGVGVIAISAGISAWQAVVATHQQHIMQGQLDEMQSEQRPWISIDNIRVVTAMAAGKDFYVRFQFKNYGNAPAPIAKACITPGALMFTKTEANFKRAVREGASACASRIRTPVMPGSGFVAHFHIPIVDQPSVDAITNDRIWLMYTGRIDYRDQRGTWRHTNLCFWYTPQLNEVDSCPYGNEAS